MIYIIQCKRCRKELRPKSANWFESYPYCLDCRRLIKKEKKK